MHLISWNVAARSSRAKEQAEVLAALNPHIIALQEITTKTRSTFRKIFSDSGFISVIDSFELTTDWSELEGRRRYGELIASRFPIYPMPPDQFQVPWQERILSVVIQSPWGDIELHTTHIPPGSSNGWIKIETFEGIYNKLAGPSQRPRILCGDFNTPQEEMPDGEVMTWAQKRSKKEELVTRRNFRGGDGRRWDAAERNILLGLAHYDLPDVFRALHGYKVKEFSWYVERENLVIGRRFDHIFASAGLRPESCNYLHKFREEGLSDHSPVEAIFHPDEN